MVQTAPQVTGIDRWMVSVDQLEAPPCWPSPRNGWHPCHHRVPAARPGTALALPAGAGVLAPGLVVGEVLSTTSVEYGPGLDDTAETPPVGRPRRRRRVFALVACLGLALAGGAAVLRGDLVSTSRLAADGSQTPEATESVPVISGRFTPSAPPSALTSPTPVASAAPKAKPKAKAATRGANTRRPAGKKAKKANRDQGGLLDRLLGGKPKR